jgi:hypothetical protein
VQWTVFAPNGTAVQVLTEGGGGAVTEIGNVGSDKKHVFDVVPNTYDLALTQGAGSKTVEDTAVNADISTDELCQLTVSAPNGTEVSVYVVDTTDVVTSIGNVGSDNKHVFDVVKGTYDVYASLSGGQTQADVDCTGETQSLTFS